MSVRSFVSSSVSTPGIRIGYIDFNETLYLSVRFLIKMYLLRVKYCNLEQINASVILLRTFSKRGEKEQLLYKQFCDIASRIMNNFYILFACS